MGVRLSMGPVGDAYDNAMAEIFFATLECELSDRRGWQTKTDCCAYQSDLKIKSLPVRAIGSTPARYRGLMKNAAQLTTLFTLSNLWMARDKWMQAVA